MSYLIRNAERAKRHLGDTPKWQVQRDTERGPCLNRESEYFSTVGALQALCDVNNIQLEYCSHYGEPGYSEPEKSILFANWNEIPKQLQKRLETQGYALEWSDEWYVDYNNDKAYRTSPDSHGWQSSLMFSEATGDYLTPDDNVSDWIAQCENNPHTALPSRIAAADLEDAGYVQTSDTYENGFYPGQNDEPVKIGAKLTEAGRDYVFQITDTGQFDVHFRVWIKQGDSNGN